MIAQVVLLKSMDRANVIKNEKKKFNSKFSGIETLFLLSVDMVLVLHNLDRARVVGISLLPTMIV